MADPTDLSLSELRSGLKARKFSAVELAESCLARIEKYSRLNCFTEVDQAAVISQAELADKELAAKKEIDRPLLGLPVAVKDIISTIGLKTTCASKMLANYRPPYDATVVQKLRKAGAVILGKTNMDEFAMGSSNENSSCGPVLNPWDISRVPGGSSGGSAAAVAACLAPAALGTDTGGSIRQPASLCSIVGIKPTYGRVSRYGVVAFASSLDQVGPFGRTVRDAAIMTGVLAGHDPLDSTSMNLAVPDFEAALDRGIKGLRVGVPKEYFIPGMDREVDQSIRTALQTLTALGAKIVEISLPYTDAAVAAYYIIAPAEASSNLARFDGVRFGFRAKDPVDLKDLYCRTRGEGFGSEVKRRIMIGTYVLSSGYYDAYYLRAQKVRALITRDFEEAFAKHCDLIACPASPTTAFKIGEKVDDPLAMYLNDVFTIPVNLAGLSGLCVPCGFDGGGLPIGLQLIGKAFDEETLFRAAHAFEEASQWVRRKPDLAKQGL